MSTEYNYDEQAKLENTAPRIQNEFVPKHADLIDGQKAKQRRRERRLKRIIAVVVGWLTMAFMCYLIAVTAKTIPKIWDPYDILGISRSLDEKAIKSHYKKLSLKFHPDKIKPNPAKNETLEDLNNHFVELTKAYKALTDEEVRNNFVQFGHPDGKQSFSIGIALPKFIVTDGNGKYVLLIYGLLLGVLLPYIVGKWWYGTQKMTRERVLIASAGNLFREYKEEITEGGIIGALSCGEEFKEVLNGEKAELGTGTVERKILADSIFAPTAGGLTSRDKADLEKLDGEVRRKTLGLLWAYLGRLDLEQVALNDEKFEIAPIALQLNESFLAIALAFGNTKPILNAYKTAQKIIQAIPPKASPLLQLPYITPTVAHAIEGSGSKTHLNVQDFMLISEEKRKRIATNAGLTKSQYETAVSVAKQIPVLNVEKAFFKVTGERYITPGSLVSFVVKTRLIPPGTTTVPEINELDLEDVDPVEGDLDALLGRKPKKPKTSGGTAKAAANTEEKPIQPALAYAPYFARDHSPRWHVFLADSKQGKMVVPPFQFTTFEKPLVDAEGKPTFNVHTFKMQFQAPPQAGQYTFVMHLICDSYVGLDAKREVKLVVEEMAKAEEIIGDDEISEPDEDSIAGQMSALKSGGLAGVAAPPKRRKKLNEDESSDDESDTEGEEGEDTDTDTDTDTDSE